MTTGSAGPDIWHRGLASQPPPSTNVVIATAVAAGLLVALSPAWHYSRHLVTITHEAAHGIMALASGRRLRGIRLHSDTSGLTVSRGRPTGMGMIATAAAGYVGPGLLGLGSAALLHGGHAVGLLWLFLVLLALMLVQIRNWFGLWSVLVTGGAVFAVTWSASPSVQTGFAYAVTWFLLLAAPRPVLELQQARRRGQAPDSDADTLARLTGVPGLVWVALFLGVTVGSLALGASWLITSAAK